MSMPTQAEIKAALAGGDPEQIRALARRVVEEDPAAARAVLGRQREFSAGLVWLCAMLVGAALVLLGLTLGLGLHSWRTIWDR